MLNKKNITLLYLSTPRTYVGFLSCMGEFVSSKVPRLSEGSTTCLTHKRLLSRMNALEIKK